MSSEEILAQALEVKQQIDEDTLLGDKLYVCMDCHQITDYWKPGMVCAQCELEGERQMEQDRGN